MLKERVTEDEIYFVVRKNAFYSIEKVSAVVLETDGTLTLIEDLETLNTAIMNYVKIPKK